MGTDRHVVIPDGVSAIGEDAFFQCHQLVSVTIPDYVTRIEESAFVNCTMLESISIPDSVTSIGTAAFDSCCNLRRVVLPSHITHIEDMTFSDCGKLVQIYCRMVSPASEPMRLPTAAALLRLCFRAAYLILAQERLLIAAT